MKSFSEYYMHHLLRESIDAVRNYNSSLDPISYIEFILDHPEYNYLHPEESIAEASKWTDVGGWADWAGSAFSKKSQKRHQARQNAYAHNEKIVKGGKDFKKYATAYKNEYGTDINTWPNDWVKQKATERLNDIKNVFSFDPTKDWDWFTSDDNYFTNSTLKSLIDLNKNTPLKDWEDGKFKQMLLKSNDPEQPVPEDASEQEILSNPGEEAAKAGRQYALKKGVAKSGSKYGFANYQEPKKQSQFMQNVTKPKNSQTIDQLKQRLDLQDQAISNLEAMIKNLTQKTQPAANVRQQQPNNQIWHQQTTNNQQQPNNHLWHQQTT